LAFQTFDQPDIHHPVFDFRLFNYFPASQKNPAAGRRRFSRWRIHLSGGINMLFAASVRVNIPRKPSRRIDLIVNAADLDAAKERAVKQARSIYLPAKKATYELMEIIDEAEAVQALQQRLAATEAKALEILPEEEPL
jgi:hypothetical protein